ncbi:MAG: hypothetical protein GY798_04290 [Hyphomicrobiales bacterium]|nr:hypothetical protein [Hyphomicrobiales bacterium]
MVPRPLILLTASLLAIPALAADSVTSAYTNIDLATCRQEPVDPDDPLQSGVWWCAGYGAIPVRVAEGDLRFLVSYGIDAAGEMAASQTLPAFNHIGQTLEWRLRPEAPDLWSPFATILRFFPDLGDGETGQVLVITKLGGSGQICHVGYVDALANPQANTLARQIADNVAPLFDCQADQPFRR